MQKGFTLIELLIVIAIVVIVAVTFKGYLTDKPSQERGQQSEQQQTK